MIAIIIGMVIIAFFCIIAGILAACMELPWLFDRKEYKVWKECYENENFKLYASVHDSEGMLIHMYKSPDLPNYCIFVFFKTRPTCAVFLDKTYHILFSSFYKKHSQKLTEKLLAIK